MTKVDKFALPIFIKRLKIIFHDEFFNEAEAHEAHVSSFPHLLHPKITMYTFEPDV